MVLADEKTRAELGWGRLLELLAARCATQRGNAEARALEPWPNAEAARHRLAEVGDPVTGVAVGPTADNLKSAIEGETYEYTEMYPGFARTARDEGFEEVAEWLETLARAEKSHAGRFSAGLEGVDA